MKTMIKKDDPYVELIKFVKEKTATTGLVSLNQGIQFLKEAFPDLSPTVCNGMDRRCQRHAAQVADKKERSGRFRPSSSLSDFREFFD